MPAAVTHILTGLFLGELIRRTFFPKYSQAYVLVAGIAGLFPDIDVALFFVLKLILGNTVLFEAVHRGFTHTIWLPLIFLAASLVALSLKKEKHFVLFYMITIGTFSHILLDFIFSERLLLFYPLSMAWNGLGLLQNDQFGRTVMLSLDAAILTLWLIYIYWRGYLKKFI